MSRLRSSISGSPKEGRVANVIVFGETGAGKSSVVNMLEGGDVAKVSDQAVGVTFSTTCYEKTILGSVFRVFDTVGLNEGSGGTVTAQEAIEGLYRLISQLDDGISLLVYVMRAPRIKATMQKNYEMFYEMFCQKKVPIVIVITGLETRSDMEGWWNENQHLFAQQGMSFHGHACITAIKGVFRDGKYLYDAEHEESKKQVQTLIYDLHADPWKFPSTTWLDNVVVRVHNFLATLFGFDVVAGAKELQLALRKYAGLSSQDAANRANEYQRKETRASSGR